MKHIVFLHGYGANSDDLKPLERFLKTDEEKQKFLFIDAPFKLNFGFNSRAWFEITSQHFAMLNEGNRDASFESYIPPELESSVDHIASVIAKDFDFKNDKLVLAGFSQGSMCALHFYRKFYHMFSFDSLVLLSSHLIGKEVLEQSYKELPHIPIFQSHGKSDMVLKFSQGENVVKFLKKNEFEVEFHEFDGGHEIPLVVLNALKLFLARE